MHSSVGYTSEYGCSRHKPIHVQHATDTLACEGHCAPVERKDSIAMQAAKQKLRVLGCPGRLQAPAYQVHACHGGKGISGTRTWPSSACTLDQTIGIWRPALQAMENFHAETSTEEWNF